MKLIVRNAAIAAALGCAAAFGILQWTLQHVIPVKTGIMKPVLFTNPYSSPQQFMEGIYAADMIPDQVLDDKPRAVIVPHHLIASTSIALGVKQLAQGNYKKIILLSPDHFGNCPTALCTIEGTYETIFGDVQTTPGVADRLLVSALVSKNADLFNQEHGIYAVLPFIKHYLPDATVTPLALSTKATWKLQRTELLALLREVLTDDTALVVSSDFSHYLTLGEAKKMDAITEKVLLSKDLDGIARLDNADQSDCPGCLWLLGATATANDFYHPVVLMHTNSAEILHDAKIPETTSHFSIIWSEK